MRDIRRGGIAYILAELIAQPTCPGGSRGTTIPSGDAACSLVASFRHGSFYCL